MTSLTAGSPTCNCKNPDTCIHAFTLTVGEKTYNYKQNEFFSAISMINRSESPLALNLSLEAKECVSGNPECPKGLIYTLNQQSSLTSFTKGAAAYNVHYDKNKLNSLESYDGITFISQYILGKRATEWLPANEYFLRIGQCHGQSFITEKITFTDGLRQIFNYAPRDRLWSVISVYPAYDWKVKVTIALDQTVTEYSDKDLRRQQTQENRETGMPHRKAAGWTKRPRYSISDSLTIKGEMSYKLGHLPRHEFGKTLEADFKRKARELTLLEDTTKALDLVGKSFSTTGDGGTKYQILDTEIIYPQISIEGGAALAEDENTRQVYMKGRVALGLTPMIGLRIKFDLLQAFAAWYGAESMADIIRQQMDEREKAVRQGSNGAYAGLKLDLIASGTLNLALIYESVSANNWEWRVDGGNEVTLALILEANARAGVKFTVLEGAFTVQAAAEVSGNAVAEGFVAFDRTPQNYIEMILYHNGVRAEIAASYSAGISADDDDTEQLGDRINSTATSSNVSGNQNDGIKKEWILHDKLAKEKSPHRLRLL